MTLVSLQSARFDYGREKILDGVDVAVYAGRKYALAGDNGTGKTTLLEVLAGELSLQGGERQVAGSLRIGFLRQETTLDPAEHSGRSVYDGVAWSAFPRELALENKLKEIARALAEVSREADQEELVQHQGRLLAEFERLDGYSLRPRLETALRGVGLPPGTWERPPAALSGGERRRAALAAVLLGEADLLLLDEPTNHLDLEACEWLEDFLRQNQSAVVLVSHDRQFLDRVADQTLHLEGGKLTAYSGNYSFFADAYRQRRRLELATYERQQQQIRKAEELIRRTMASGKQKTRQAQSRQKQLARLVRKEKPIALPRDYRIRLQADRPSGRMVLEAAGLTRSIQGRDLFRDLDLLVNRGDRIGIVGPNGCGKSTLLRILAGRERPDAGIIKQGPKVDLGLYDQEIRSVADHHTVLEEMAAVDPAATEGELRGFLGAFGFDEDMVDRKVGRLSGGERGRLALMRLIKEGHNTLLLDEPTNHLDVRCRESLEEALEGFDGTLVVVSHDRRFLDKVISRLLVFPAEAGGGEVQQFLGNYADFHRRRHHESQGSARARAQAGAQAATKTGPRAETKAVSASGEGRSSPGSGPATGTGTTPLSKNEKARRRAWIAEAEERIAELEKQRAEILGAMSKRDLSPAERVELGDRCAEIDRRLAVELQQWEQWNLELAEEPYPG